MHYTGTIWRPPYETDSLILEATAGCAHHRCKFCTLYDELPFKFKVSELSTMESDLLEAQTWFHDPLSKIETRLFNLPMPKRCRVFLAGANPFVLKARRLLEISDLIREYFPSCETIGCFARVTDVASKTDEELVALRKARYTGLTIGIETGDDAALAFMNKGYAAQDIVAQCARLDAADISYAFFFLRESQGKDTVSKVRGSRRQSAIKRTPPSSAQTCSPSTRTPSFTKKSLLATGRKKRRLRSIRRLKLSSMGWKFPWNSPCSVHQTP